MAYLIMHILVTGGAGFLGSHLCDALISQGHRVICLDNFATGMRRNIAHLLQNRRFRLIQHDVTEPILLSGISRIYHLASPASPKDFLKIPVEILLANSFGTQNMLELARRNKARFLYASSSEVYGDPEEHPQKETYFGNVNSVGVRSCYDEGKRFGEALCMAYQRMHGVPVRIARIFNTYGPRMRKNDGRVIPNFVMQALARKPITIYGNGAQTRSFCYVNDMVAGLMAFMETEKPPLVVNLGNPKETSIKTLAQMIKKMTGSRSRVVQKPIQKDDPKVRRPSVSLARGAFGFRPRVSLEKGLPLTIHSFQH